MMLVVDAILGNAGDPGYAGRCVERLAVASDEASKRRLRRSTDAGTDVAVDLPRGSYLGHDAVLHDDGQRIIVVERMAEPTLVIRFDPGLPVPTLVRNAVLLGHAFGNQHAPLDIDGCSIHVPLTTSESVARATVAALGLTGATVTVDEVQIGRAAPLAAGHVHEHAAPHDPAHNHAPH